VASGADAQPVADHPRRIFGHAPFAGAPDRDGDPAPDLVVLVLRPGQRVRELVQDRLADLGLVVQPRQRSAQADGARGVLAHACAALGVVELDAPPVESVLVTEVACQRVGLVEFHDADPTRAHRQPRGRPVRLDPPVRIGTWNLAGRWSDDHAALLLDADCDVWLLTEVNERTALPGYALHLSQSSMAARRRWAGIASRLPMASSPDPHPASAQVQIGTTTYVSSILPWRTCGSRPPWVGPRHADKTRHTVDDLLLRLRAADDLVWGGDWNHALSGREYAGSKEGRAAIAGALDELDLVVPTTDQPHVKGGLSIDHVAVRRGRDATATRVVAAAGGKRLSDHDAYVVEVAH
jgi:endonuclease/exonuclease/phosphatase family metal-dependent hydrolase